MKKLFSFFIPKRIVAANQDGELNFFNIHIRFDGRINIKEAKNTDNFPKHKPSILALDPEMLYRRKGSFIPSSKQSLYSVVTDLFPFPEEELSFACATDQNETPYFYAADDKIIENLESKIKDPISIIIAKANPESLKKALSERFKHGAITDLKTSKIKLLNPAYLITSGLSATILLSIIGSYTIIQNYQEHKLQSLQTEVQKLEKEVNPLIEKRQTVAKMQKILQKTADFNINGTGPALEILSNIMDSIPTGTIIDRIEIKDNTLKVTGTGKQNKDWLLASGLPESAIEISNIPGQGQRFKINISIKEVKQ